MVAIKKGNKQQIEFTINNSTISKIYNILYPNAGTGGMHSRFVFDAKDNNNNPQLIKIGNGYNVIENFHATKIETIGDLIDLSDKISKCDELTQKVSYVGGSANKMTEVSAQDLSIIFPYQNGQKEFTCNDFLFTSEQGVNNDKKIFKKSLKENPYPVSGFKQVVKVVGDYRFKESKDENAIEKKYQILNCEGGSGGLHNRFQCGAGNDYRLKDFDGIVFKVNVGYTIISNFRSGTDLIDMTACNYLMKGEDYDNHNRNNGQEIVTKNCNVFVYGQRDMDTTDFLLGSKNNLHDEL
jgi:hypothetical protein